MPKSFWNKDEIEQQLEQQLEQQKTLQKQGRWSGGVYLRPSIISQVFRSMSDIRSA
jgi:uncharacterized protein YcgI (DUF1989 family)